MKNLILNRPVLYGIAMIICFAFGRYTATFKKTESVSKQQDQEVVTKRTTIRKKNPNGSSETVVVVDSATRNHSAEIIAKNVEYGKSKLNVSVLGGFDFTKPAVDHVYGLSVTKQVFGPIIIGGFGLTNKTYGLSVGLTF